MTWHVHHFGKTWRMTDGEFGQFVRARMRDASVQPDKYGRVERTNLVTLNDLDDMIDNVVESHNARVETREKLK